MRRRPAAVLVASLVLLVLRLRGVGLAPGDATFRTDREPSGRGPRRGRRPRRPGVAPPRVRAQRGPGRGGRASTWPEAPATGSPSRPPRPSVTLPEADGTLRMRLVGSNPSPVAHRRRAPPRPHQLPHRRRPVGLADRRPDLRPGVVRRRLAGRRPGLPRRPAPAAARLRGRPRRRPVGHRRRVRPRPRRRPRSVDPATGDLLVGAARLSRPTIYQDVDGHRRPVEGAFRLLGGHGRRSASPSAPTTARHPLVIDPTLVTSSYLGGSGIDNAAAVDVDGGGNVYIVGSTESSDFRTTNPSQATLNGDGSAGKSDAFVAKLNPEGTTAPLRHLPRRHQPRRGRGRGRGRRRQRVRDRRHRVRQLPEDDARGPGRTTAAGPATPSSPSSTPPGRR